jgi:hypothetical protein
MALSPGGRVEEDKEAEHCQPKHLAVLLWGLTGVGQVVECRISHARVHLQLIDI